MSVWCPSLIFIPPDPISQCWFEVFSFVKFPCVKMVGRVSKAKSPAILIFPEELRLGYPC
jgi:hypothetical protein